MRYILCALSAIVAFAWTIYLARAGMLVPSVSCLGVIILTTVGAATTGYGLGVLCTHIDMELLKD